MNYQKTEQEINENAKIEATEENSQKKRVKFKDLPSKEKKKRTIIGIICLVLAFILIFGDVFGSSDSGSTNLGFTLAEFVDRYNSTVDTHLKDDSTASVFAQVESMLKLDVEYFVQSDEDTYIADNNGIMGYMANMADNSDKVYSMTFMFSNELTDEQTEIMIIICKWVFEAVVPDMGKEYYSQTLSEVIEVGELEDDNYIYSWDEYDSSYGFLIVPKS